MKRSDQTNSKPLDSAPIASTQTPVQPLQEAHKINPHLNRQQIQQHYGISVKTLERLFSKGIGPVAIKIGRRVLYPAIELEDWLKRHRTHQ